MQFVQVKLATDDPDRLAQFYVEGLGCKVVRQTVSLDQAAASGAGTNEEITITILSFPGAVEGPNLELITGTGLESGGGVLTFYVDDVAEAAECVAAAGGSYRGEITEFVAPNGGTFRFVFMTDPEGNVVDLFQAVG